MLQEGIESDEHINALPESGSSKASSSELSLPPSPEPDTPPPTKRRKLERLTSQHVDLTSTSPVEKARGNGTDTSSQPSNIRATQFTSLHPTNDSSKRRNNLPSSSQSSRHAQGSEAKEVFADFYSSQSKGQSRSQNRYRSHNIHKAAPLRAKDKGVEKLEKKTGKNKQAIQRGLQKSEDKGTANDFQAPPVLMPSLRSKRAARRSAKDMEEQQKSARDTTFRKPPRPPSPQNKKPCPSPFVVPQGPPPETVPRRSHSSDKTSRIAIPLEVADLETIKAKLNLQLDATTSSSALSSGPSFEFDNDGSNSSSSLSSARDVEELDASDIDKEWIESHPPGSPRTQCPICKAHVSRLFMEEFAGPKLLSVRQQQRFCKAHKVHSAESVWKDKEYPIIDWHGFQRRLPKYDTALRSVLRGTCQSFYRNMFEEQIKTGANRRLKQAVLSGNASEGLNMGYYGTKGARIIMEYIMANFASRIRRMAGTDKLISAGGVSGFVQAVLAPELAVLLVKDDMRVDDEQARVILKESFDIGNLLNEEEDEAIKDEEDEDNKQIM
ncbi:MAG: hypothetical protein LQ343_004285 [Gyalolechia ehrenbergii]|nr:MAG: hypothetical protein LQ343_004285 [Gyalolechia ehrenbergii]